MVCVHIACQHYGIVIESSPVYYTCRPNLFQMAQNMQQTNPQLFESLRQQFPGAGTGPGTGTGTGAPPQPKPDGQ